MFVSGENLNEQCCFNFSIKITKGNKSWFSDHEDNALDQEDETKLGFLISSDCVTTLRTEATIITKHKVDILERIQIFLLVLGQNIYCETTQFAF